MTFAERRRVSWRRHAVPALALLFAPACMVGPNYKPPKTTLDPSWRPSSVAAPRPLNPADAYWWKVFDDPVLEGLIESAYQDNLTLQIAGVRVLQARAQLNASIGELFPQAAVSGGVTYEAVYEPQAVDTATDNLLFAASWEPDLWGKIRRGIQADRAAYLGTLASYDDALVTVIADVASTYVNLRTAEERLRVAARNVEVQKEGLRVASVQFRYGATSELDVRQAESLLAQTQARIPPLEDAVRQAKNALALLLGTTPGAIEQRLAGPGRVPVAPAEVAVGVPHDLLRRRPDVRAAGLTAASQSALIGVAVANMYPALTLSGTFGFAASSQGTSSLADLFNWSSRLVQLGASFLFPVFNRGRLVNQVRVRDAQFQAAVLSYQNVVLAAQREVEDGLSAFATSRQALESWRAAALAGERSGRLALEQYKAGATNYTTVVTSEQSQLAIEDGLATTEGSVALGLIAVYRALGGGWELRADRDVVSDAVKAEMARRTNWGHMLEVDQHIPKLWPVEEP
jgi:NodT family efflux transporter outer membrane factor (OMF) lipoprotein